MMTLTEASSVARRVAPPFLRNADPVPAYEDAESVIVAYRRESPDDVFQDLYVAVVHRATGSAKVVPFINVIDSVDEMRDLTPEG